MSGSKGAPVVEVKDLNISFKTAAGVIKVVENVSFTISKGECLAVVGESGSGKSVSALATIGLLVKDQSIVTGSVLFRGEELLGKPESYMRKIRGGGISMIFQEPLSALNPVTTIGEQIAEVLVAHGRAGWREANKKAPRTCGDRAGTAARQAVSASALRRHASARDDRHGARWRTGADHR